MATPETAHVITTDGRRIELEDLHTIKFEDIELFVI